MIATGIGSTSFLLAVIWQHGEVQSVGSLLLVAKTRWRAILTKMVLTIRVTGEGKCTVKPGDGLQSGHTAISPITKATLEGAERIRAKMKISDIIKKRWNEIGTMHPHPRGNHINQNRSAVGPVSGVNDAANMKTESLSPRTLEGQMQGAAQAT